ncbi:MAG: Holliday junction resolvase RuvX [Bacilli bacterium]|nr:Holliday junction resolvase RuvX [Bacilli bacterium]
MRYLGLDLGTKTLGVALSDNLGLIASKYGTLNFKNEDYMDALNKLKPIVEKFNITTVVLGIPKNMNNTLGFAAERSLNFKKIIQDELKLNVIMQDERLTSVEANNILIKGNISRKKRKQSVDSLSAVIILQSYLDKRKEV